MPLNQLTIELEKYLKKLFKTRSSLISAISNYGKTSSENLHSWLQHSIIHTGESLGYKAVPEIKMYYETPLDPNKYSVERKRKNNFKRVDVGLYNHNELTGCAEVITMDEAHGGAKSNELLEPWLTPRDSLNYLVQNCVKKPEFCLILNVLPRRANTIPWKTTKRKHEELKKTRDYYSVFICDWRTLVKELNQHLDSKLITVIDAENIEVYP